MRTSNRWSRKKSCTVDRDWLSTTWNAGFTHGQLNAPVVTQPFFPRTKFMNLHNFENTYVINVLLTFNVVMLINSNNILNCSVFHVWLHFTAFLRNQVKNSTLRVSVFNLVSQKAVKCSHTFKTLQVRMLLLNSFLILQVICFHLTTLWFSIDTHTTIHMAQ